MNRITSAIFLSLAIALVAAQNRRPNEKIPEVSQRCLDCICQASSNCDESIKCHNSGGGGYFCGSYVISWGYWHDGGRQGDKGRAHDFETCLNNKACAEQTVKSYMKKHGQDCDGNGVIDCSDFARIHKLGYGSCSGDAIQNTDYWEKFEICHNGYEPPANPQPNYEYDETPELDARRNQE